MDEDARLLGRDAEQSALESLLAAARDGTSGAMLLSGEAGIGETALLTTQSAGPPACSC